MVLDILSMDDSHGFEDYIWHFKNAVNNQSSSTNEEKTYNILTCLYETASSAKIHNTISEYKKLNNPILSK